MCEISRRTALAGIGSAGLLTMLPAHASPLVRVTKDPNCGCCSAWVSYVQTAGFATRIEDSNELAALKERLLIPPSLYSCHTAEVAGYVIEGHVPAEAIRRLLAERPKALGLAVAGMPIGSPGMEVPNAKDEIYNVVLFGPTQQQVFARFKGAKEIPARP